MNIRLLKKTDIAVIVDGFKESGWQIKPASVFAQYLDEQDKRICFVAFIGSLQAMSLLNGNLTTKILQMIISQKYLISMCYQVLETKGLVQH